MQKLFKRKGREYSVRGKKLRSFLTPPAHQNEKRRKSALAAVALVFCS
jgi:hypothetical protein